MSGQYPPSVELAVLYERTSAKGTRYMTGLLGLGRVTLLPAEPAADGTPTWRLLIGARQAAGERKPATDSSPPRTYADRRAYRPARSPVRPDSVAPPELDDSVDDLWRGDGR